MSAVHILIKPTIQALNLDEVVLAERELSRKHLDALKGMGFEQEVHDSGKDDRRPNRLSEHSPHQGWSDHLCGAVVDRCQRIEQCHHGNRVTWYLRHGSDQIGASFVFKIAGDYANFDLVHDRLGEEVGAARDCLDSLGGYVPLLFVLTCSQDMKNQMLHIEPCNQETG